MSNILIILSYPKEPTFGIKCKISKNFHQFYIELIEVKSYYTYLQDCKMKDNIVSIV